MLYNLAIQMYGIFIWGAQFFSKKAKLWWNGRQGLWKTLQLERPGPSPIWIHCSSLGEFEQGRPVIEQIKAIDPSQKIVLTFFSPSGYEIRKGYSEADYIYYLPLDTRTNAMRFLRLLKPKLAIFVKYDFWFNYLNSLASTQTPFLFISVIFYPNHFLFKKWSANLFDIFKKADCIFVQNQESHAMLQNRGVGSVVAGDTRVDRVIKIQSKGKSYPLVASLCQGRTTIIFGSVWPEDMAIVSEWINAHMQEYFFIIAPHDVSARMLSGVIKQTFGTVQRLSNLENRHTDVVIVDTIGDLAHLYKYTDVGYIGGGFGNGIHSILEPVSARVPVVFGPNYAKFQEAETLIGDGAAISVRNKDAFGNAMQFFIEKENRNHARYNIDQFLDKSRGASDTIIQYLKGQKWI